VKETMARQAQKEAAALKKKLEVTEQKAKDAATDLQAVIEGKLPRSPQADSTCVLIVEFFDLVWMQAPGRPRMPSRRSWPRLRTK
jgi:hypothetical protein